MAANFRTCPQCATRNRLDKEFCVKCGEPLEGVKAGDPTATKKGKPGFFVTEEGEAARSPLVPLVLVILTIGVAVAAWQTLQNTETAAATPPSTAPQRQPSIPVATIAPVGPGVQEYTAGMAALRAGDLPGAVRLLGLAVSATPTNADYRLGLAEALEKSGSTVPALVEYQAAAGLGAANVRYSGEWAKALNRAGRNTDAIRAYEAALQIDPQHLSNLRELASLHLRANDFAKARPHLEKIVALQPDDLAPKQSLARTLEAAQDLPAAAKQYRDILSAMPQADLTRALLSDVLTRQNKPEEGLQLLEERLRVDPNSAILHREKGRILDRQGRNSEAIEAYREYLRLSPGATDNNVFTARIQQLSPPKD